MLSVTFRLLLSVNSRQVTWKWRSLINCEIRLRKKLCYLTLDATKTPKMLDFTAELVGNAKLEPQFVVGRSQTVSSPTSVENTPAPSSYLCSCSKKQLPLTTCKTRVLDENLESNSRLCLLSRTFQDLKIRLISRTFMDW